MSHSCRISFSLFGKILTVPPTYVPSRSGGIRRLPRVLTASEAKRLLAIAQSPRDRAIVAIGLYAGLRVSEIRNLVVEDIDQETGLIHVRQGKGGKDSTLPLNPLLAPYLLPLLEGKAPDLPLFPAPYPATGHMAPDGKLTTRAIEYMIGRLAAQAGLRGVHPHTLRHTYGTELQRRGGDIAKTQRLMRHANIQTTMIYVHLAVEDVRRLANELDFETIS